MLLSIREQVSIGEFRGIKRGRKHERLLEITADSIEL